MPRDDFPRIGLGTWDLRGDTCERIVADALDLGYRHVDTAQMYENEAAVGAGIEDADVPRDAVFLATKIHHRNLPAPTPADVRAAVEASLERLDTEYLDLLYVHWPTGDYDPAVTLPAFDELRDEGVIRHVGMCNATIEVLDAARDVLDSPIFAHQVEMHPLLPQADLVADAASHGHALVAYCPLMQGGIVDVPELQEIAADHDLSPAQLSLAWLLSHDPVHVIPRTADPDHLRENLAATDLDIDDDAIAAVDAIARENRVIDNPEAPWHA